MMHWYAVNTKPHHERLAELNLGRLRVEIFYPQMKRKKVIRRREETVSGPLFPGYLFARFDLDVYNRAVTYSGGVRCIVTFGSVPAIVDDEIIEGIRARLKNGFLTFPVPSFTPGEVVRIQAGPLQGLEAVFERQTSDHERVVLLLRALAYQARVVVPLEQIVNI